MMNKRTYIFKLIIFTTLYLMAYLFYIDTHEVVHEKNCLYHGGTVIKRTFTSVLCDGERNDDINVMNEVVYSIITFVLLTTFAFGIIYIMRDMDKQKH